MPRSPYHDVLIVAQDANAFTLVRRHLWDINRAGLTILAMTDPQAEGLMRHLGVPNHKPWSLAHRYSAEAWQQVAADLQARILVPARGWTAIVEEATGDFTGASSVLRHLATLG